MAPASKRLDDIFSGILIRPASLTASATAGYAFCSLFTSRNTWLKLWEQFMSSVAETRVTSSWVTLPNAITVGFKILLPVAAPLFACYKWIVFGIDYRLTILAIIVVAAASDKIDGWVARTLRQESKLGATLDPLSDGIFTSLAVIALFICWGPGRYVVVVYGAPTVLIPWLALMTARLRKQGKIHGSSPDAKVKTFVMSLTLICLAVSMNLEGWLSLAFEGFGILLAYQSVFLSFLSYQDYERKARARASN